MRAAAVRLRCKFVASPRPSEEDKATPMLSEHGDFTGATALQDLYMLSKSDVLIGTRLSSFSVRAAAQMALSSVKRGKMPVVIFVSGQTAAGVGDFCNNGEDVAFLGLKENYFVRLRGCKAKMMSFVEEWGVAGCP